MPASNPTPTPAPKPHCEHRPVDRRNFLRQTSAAAAVAIPLSASSYARALGSQERLRIGFLGCGGRAQAHIHLIARMAADTGRVSPAAVCDVWDGLEEEYTHAFGTTTTRRQYSQGLFPSARKCGLDPNDRTHVVKDYRRLLDLKEIDAVCITTPDHWHARMCLDAAAAGKDVLVEKPMTRTVSEARLVTEAMQRHGRVCSVGVQALADPSWKVAQDLIQAGRIGAPVQLGASVFRADPRGMWRFYRLVEAMNPQTIAWDLFLGHRFEVDGVPLGPTPAECPFDRTAFAQWRCDSRFSGGPFTDLYVHAVSRLLAATGFRTPSRIIGSGGLYHERDGRDVPDVATIIAEFDAGCQMLITGSTAHQSEPEEIIRGRHGMIRFQKNGLELIGKTGSETIPTSPPRHSTQALWENFLDCVRRRDRNTLSPPDLGAAAVAIVATAFTNYQLSRGGSTPSV
ncbi:MAG: Gfo/Idh/MocA family oxidoreductase [Bacteroidales bacterium]|nr:Gfo/Idh/MocA family oxidoreductase [Bacteroidales bacterium]